MMLIPRFASSMKAVIALLGLMAALSEGVSLAQEPSKTPILRIETVMHNAAIARAAVDPANQFLVTISLDKTLRIWDLQTATIIRVIRPPIGTGIAGHLYALAISPDGNTIACGGNTSERPEDESIYIIDRASGSIVRRIQGLSSIVIGLAYSKDGSLLSVSLSKSGIRLFETQTYRLVAEDKQDLGVGYGADFTAKGKLVTSSGDGYIRLYDVRNGLRLIAKKKGNGDKLPARVSVSPDGDKIAVGFHTGKIPQVSVLSATDLSSLYSPDTTGVIHPIVAGLQEVAWSADGSALFAGGNFGANGTSLIRKWAGAGRGPYQDLPASKEDVSSIVSLKDGGIVFTTGWPAFGVLNGDGTKRLFKGPEKFTVQLDKPGDIKRVLEGFLVSTDAKTIEFGDTNSTVRFSLADKRLEHSPAPLDSLRPPLTQSPGLNITDWFLRNYPKLDGKVLKIDYGTISLSLSIAPDKTHFLLSTSNSLRLFDRNGVQRWILPSGGGLANISGDGRFAVASQTDGTIRWYRMTDGKELLALFPHRDKKRWVLWTPSGYYDASPGGEELIGWHLNKGADQSADFFPVGQFRSTYYRPDVIAKVLETSDETVALRLANEESGRKYQLAELSQRLPPVVEIASPTDGAETTATEITVRFRVRTPSGEPVTGIKALVDGRPVSGGRGLKHSGQASDIQELKVTVPEQDSEISLLAENKYAMSVPATVRVRWRGATASKDEFIIKPKLYVLAVGVSKYANKDLTLGFAAKDASDFVATVERQKGGLYRDVVVKLLTDENATKDEVLDGLDWIRKETTSKDVAMVFMAGHGVNDQNGFYFFCPYNLDPEKILRTGVPFSDIKNTVSSLAGKTLFFVDTCHSGNVMGTRRALVDVTGIVNELASAENGAVVFAASTGNQYSLENVEWGNGAFTKALVEGLSGRADYGGRGKITINMIDLYLSERVKELTRGKQTPTTTKPQTIQDFPIAVKQ